MVAEIALGVILGGATLGLMYQSLHSFFIDEEPAAALIFFAVAIAIICALIYYAI